MAGQDAEKVLRKLMLDYFRRSDMQGVVRALQEEMHKHGDDTDLSDIQGTRDGFLLDWFALFWETYSTVAARLNPDKFNAEGVETNNAGGASFLRELAPANAVMSLNEKGAQGVGAKQAHLATHGLPRAFSDQGSAPVGKGPGQGHSDPLRVLQQQGPQQHQQVVAPHKPQQGWQQQQQHAGHPGQAGTPGHQRKQVSPTHSRTPSNDRFEQGHAAMLYVGHDKAQSPAEDVSISSAMSAGQKRKASVTQQRGQPAPSSRQNAAHIHASGGMESIMDVGQGSRTLNNTVQRPPAMSGRGPGNAFSPHLVGGTGTRGGFPVDESRKFLPEDDTNDIFQSLATGQLTAPASNPYRPQQQQQPQQLHHGGFGNAGPGNSGNVSQHPYGLSGTSNGFHASSAEAFAAGTPDAVPGHDASSIASGSRGNGGRGSRGGRARGSSRTGSQGRTSESARGRGTAAGTGDRASQDVDRKEAFASFMKERHDDFGKVTNKQQPQKHTAQQDPRQNAAWLQEQQLLEIFSEKRSYGVGGSKSGVPPANGALQGLGLGLESTPLVGSLQPSRAGGHAMNHSADMYANINFEQALGIQSTQIGNSFGNSSGVEDVHDILNSLGEDDVNP
ncbi:hypothetical protein FVE85_1940 [Porphyridium purpureum]|uniref:LisH domain-containing protein n=1 Tax=Porphyridium purpureum TaxID=35688 RepID=A0A5J4YXB3_PORPP|nr:hypothetical protein FVE85_1940 [Porphyridium purpureum]|eukprot:POR5870..scf209_3